MGIIDSVTDLLNAWYEQIGLTDAAPAVQLAFLYSVMALFVGLYVLVRVISREGFGFVQLWSRTRQLEKQSIQLATENDQLRKHILGLYDYLIQFENKQPAAEQPKRLSSIVERSEIALVPDFEIVVDEYPKIPYPVKDPTVRRLSRNRLAEQAGIDLEADHLTPLDSDPAYTRPSGVQTIPAQPAPALEPSSKTIRTGLAKTRGEFFSKLSALFKGKGDTASAAIDALEELLITSDLGVKTTDLLLGRAREHFAGTKNVSEGELREFLRQAVFEIVDSKRPPEILPEKREGLPAVVMVVGVNGAGKTTTIGKLAWQFRAQGKRVLVAACDTFRAAAVEQLQVWAERSGVQVVHGSENAKPSTVAYEAVHRAKSEGYDVLLIDTAGRLHTRVNLMNELSNVVRIVEREQPGAPHETILVVDASTGQNALQQAIEFNDKAKLSGIVLTKLDGTSKGGILVAIRNELDVPIRYVGVGEGVTDLKLFSASEFTDALFGQDDPAQLHAAA